MSEPDAGPTARVGVGAGGDAPEPLRGQGGAAGWHDGAVGGESAAKDQPEEWFITINNFTSSLKV